MEHFNTSLFLLLNAPAHPPEWLLWLARLCAETLIWLVPTSLLTGWLRGDEALRRSLLSAALAGIAGLLVNQGLGLVWQHPRPFMIGLGHTFIRHVADSSFPSDHLTLLWSVAAGLSWHERTRTAGGLLAVLGVPMAWARIYLGVHFPADMAGAALVSVIVATSLHYLAEPLAGFCYGLACPLHQRLFRPLILRGWVRP